MSVKTVIILIVISLVLLGGGVWLVSRSAGAEKNYDGFAQCLAEKGLTMYGAEWCPHCRNEKARFGDSFQYVPYIECPDNVQLCLEKGIQGYPTWIDNQGTKYEGEQGLAGLARISNCQLPN